MRKGRLYGSEEERKGAVVHERPDAHDHGLVGGTESAGVV